MRRRTKIICTVGPATSDYSMLERMYGAGMDVVRLNMSHADHEAALKVITWIKTLNRKVRYPVPLLLDTMGPEIRTGDLDAPMRLEPDQEVYLTVEFANPSDRLANEIHVNYPELLEAVAVGSSVTLDNGLINLEVLQKSERALRCRVVDGGSLGSRKHINLPGVHVNLPAIAGKDREDILFGMAQDLDFLALSFVRSADDIAAARELFGKKTLKVIAKIEDREGLANVEEIAQRGRRRDGRPGRSRHRGGHRGHAQHTAQPRADLRQTGQTLRCRHPPAGIDDREPDSDARGSDGRRQRHL